MGLNHLQSQVRALVADDHATVRQGLCSLLKQLSDIQVVGEAAKEEEAVALADSVLLNVILMDITMPRPLCKGAGHQPMKCQRSARPAIRNSVSLNCFPPRRILGEAC